MTDTSTAPLDATLEEREARYASFRDNSSVAQQLKDVIRASPNWAAAPSYVKEALDMIASKISRQLTGDLLYADNMHDIEGYARLMQGYAAEDREMPPMPSSVLREEMERAVERAKAAPSG